MLPKRPHRGLFPLFSLVLVFIIIIIYKLLERVPQMQKYGIIFFFFGEDKRQALEKLV